MREQVIFGLTDLLSVDVVLESPAGLSLQARFYCSRERR